jgi:hypothetical protein
MAGVNETYSNYQVLLLYEFLPPKTRINSDKYCETLKKICEVVKRKTGRLTAGVRLLHNGA